MPFWLHREMSITLAHENEWLHQQPAMNGDPIMITVEHHGTRVATIFMDSDL